MSRARTRTELRRGNSRVLAHGAVLTRPEDPTRADWAALGIALGGASAALTGWDALQARGLRTGPPPDDVVVVLTRHGSNRVVGGVRVRETIRPYSVTMTSVDNPYPLAPVAGVARAVADAALRYDWAGPVRGLVTAAVQRQLCATGDLVAELAGCPRQRSALLRAALTDALDGARSAAEAVATRRMTSARLPAFELNVPIVRAGRVLFVVDVLWRALRAGLEIDSREYHFGEAEWKATMRRHNALTRVGLALTHYPPSTVSDRFSGWTDEVAEWLRARSAELGISLPRGRGVIRPPAGGPEPLVLA